MRLFVLNGSEILGRRVADAVGTDIAPQEERDFAGGEHKARPLVGIRDADVVILHGLQGGPTASANDRLARLLFFAATCREHGAARVVALVPYLAYSRKDRQTKPRDPVTTRYVAQLFEAVGVDAVVTLDVHNLAAFQNAFRCRSLHVATHGAFAADIAARRGDRPVTILSPDPGGVKRAQLLREALEEIGGAVAGFAFMEKRRSAGVVSGVEFAGDVAGRAVHVVDDMICGGGTILRAAEAARARGAAEVHAIATHGLFDAEAVARLGAEGALDSLTVTDSVAPFSLPLAGLGPGLRVLGCAPLLAEALGRVLGFPGRHAAGREMHLPRVDPGP